MQIYSAELRAPRTWNVMVPVVDLIEADTAEQAIATLKARLRRAGFRDQLDYAGTESNAFESDVSKAEAEQEHYAIGGNACACGEVFAHDTILGQHLARKRRLR